MPESLNNPTRLDDAVKMGMSFMLTNVPSMDKTDQEQTRRILRDQLSEQDFSKYSLLTFLNFLHDLMGDYLDDQDEKDGDWDE